MANFDWYVERTKNPSKRTQYMKAKCPHCGKIFNYPKEDRVNVVLFGNWKKYHNCYPYPSGLNPSKRK